MTVVAPPAAAGGAGGSFGQQLAERLRRRAQAARWRADPVAWVHEGLDEAVWSKQAEILRAVRDHRLVAVQSSHGIGKTATAAYLVGYYLTNFPPGSYFVVTTAPTWSQVRTVLWRYIARMHSAGDLPGYVTQNAEWKIGNQVVGVGRKPADTDHQGMQGIHAWPTDQEPPGVVAIIDESSGVPEQIWNAIDSLATTDASRILAIGNPDAVSSRFYRVCTTEPGWHRIKVSTFDTPAFTGEDVPAGMAAGLVSRGWQEDKALRWGEQSALYRVKVLGEFADDDDSALIPRSWVLAANDRWRQWHERREASAVRLEPPGRRLFGVDVAWRGEDRTAIAPRQGDVVHPDGVLDEHGQAKIPTYVKQATTDTTDRVVEHLDSHPGAWAAIDVSGGWGAGPYDQLQRAGYVVDGFNAGRGTKRRDSTGLLRFPNIRSASWWNLRELLDPSMGSTLALPPDDDLMADLTTPTWEQRAGGMLVVEEKDDIKKRLGHSPDVGDSVVIACWSDSPPRGADLEEPPSRARRPGPLHHQDRYEDPDPIPQGAGEIAAMPDDDLYL